MRVDIDDYMRLFEDKQFGVYSSIMCARKVLVQNFSSKTVFSTRVA